MSETPRWSGWAWLIPAFALWTAELPLLVFRWGFTDWRGGALGPLVPLGFYLLGGGAVAGVGWLVSRVLRVPPESRRGWLLRWCIAWLWGGLVLGGALGAALMKGPPPQLGFMLGVSLLATALLWGASGPALRALERQMGVGGSLVALPVLALVASGLSLVPGWMARATHPGRPNILIVTIDTCNVGHLSTYGYPLATTPNLAAIAKEGRLFEQAWAHVGLTGPSHASIFTGLLPQTLPVYDNANALPSSAITLAEQCRAAGYTTIGIPGNLMMQARYNFQQGFDRYPQWNHSFGLRSLQWEHLWPQRWERLATGAHFQYASPRHDAELQTDNALRALAGAARGPWFLWVHYFDAHAPYEADSTDYLERLETPDLNLGQIGTNGGLFNVSFWGLEPLFGACDLAHQGVHPLVISPGEERDLIRTYDAQLRHIDTALGRLWQTLEQQGALENTVAVITADHGEHLGDDYFGHSYFINPAELHVPLILREPSGRWAGTRESVPVGLTDIAPTLRALADLPTPPRVTAAPIEAQGISLVGKSIPPRPIPLFRLDQSRGVLTPDLDLLIFRARWGQEPRAVRPFSGPPWWWSNLGTDPGARRNGALDPDAFGAAPASYGEFLRLQGQLDHWVRAVEGVGPADVNYAGYLRESLSAEELDFLIGNGYLGGAQGQALPDESECVPPTEYTAAAQRALTESSTLPE